MKKYFVYFIMLICCGILTSCSPKSKTEDSNRNEESNEIMEAANESNQEETTTLVKAKSNTAIEDRVNYEPVTGDNITVAVEFTKDMLEENFEKMLQSYSYDETMKKAMKNADTKKVIMYYNVELGKFFNRKEAYSLSYGAYHSVMVPVEGTLSNYNIQVNFDGHDNIVGFTYVEYSEKKKSKEKIIPKDIMEMESSFISDGFLLQGTLTIPKKGSDFPVVIFVHGFGPSDRDESIYENKPFQDIAWSLAEQGIASYRYDKRTFLYVKEMTDNVTFTIYDETIYDVVAAAKMVSNLKGIDSSQIYILGHSMGGYVIPLIANELPDAAGFIMMSGPAQHKQEYILRQYEYLAKEDGVIVKDEQNSINIMSRQIALLDAPNDIPDNKLILGAYKSYWIDLAEYDAMESAKKIKAPVLVLQGERDYQVTMEQFNLWKENYGMSDQWKFHSYPTLNHLMMSGEGNPSPTEYTVKATVDQQVIHDIVDFVN